MLLIISGIVLFILLRIAIYTYAAHQQIDKINNLLLERPIEDTEDAMYFVRKIMQIENTSALLSILDLTKWSRQDFYPL